MFKLIKLACVCVFNFYTCSHQFNLLTFNVKGNIMGGFDYLYSVLPF